MKNQTLKEFIIENLGIITYTDGYMEKQIEFLKPYKKGLMSGQFQILSVENFYDYYDEEISNEIIINENENIVVYTNIYNLPNKMNKDIILPY